MMKTKKDMRRSERKIEDLHKIVLAMKACNVCRVAFFDMDYPYIVPMNFGMEVNENKITLYFHGAKEGRKIDLLKQNPHVAFEMDIHQEFQYHEEEACQSTMDYICIMGTGIMSLAKEEEKISCLNHLMMQYHPATQFHYNEHALKNITVMKLEVQTISGKAK